MNCTLKRTTSKLVIFQPIEYALLPNDILPYIYMRISGRIDRYSTVLFTGRTGKRNEL